MSVVINGTTGITSVNGSAAAPSVTGADTDTGIVYGTNTLSLATGGTTAVTVDSSQNVGIGTSPTARLQVADASGATRVVVDNTSNAAAGAGIYFRTLSGGSLVSNATLRTDNAGNFSIFTGTSSDTERARIDTSGNLLVGKTSASYTTAGVWITSTGIVNSAAASLDFWNTYNTAAGAYRFYVSSAGTVYATSTSISAISDQRLKENVRDLDTGLDSIMALQPRRFDWKEGKGQDKKDVAGFIAQEFETVFPECVSTSKAGEDGIEYKNISHETLIPTLVKAIQELKAEFDAYKAAHP